MSTFVIVLLLLVVVSAAVLVGGPRPSQRPVTRYLTAGLVGLGLLVVVAAGLALT